MFGALAEFERSLIRERTQAGLAAARRAGRTGGRPPKLTDNDIEAAKVTLANPDIGVTQIAHRLGFPVGHIDDQWQTVDHVGGRIARVEIFSLNALNYRQNETEAGRKPRGATRLALDRNIWH